MNALTVSLIFSVLLTGGSAMADSSQIPPDHLIAAIQSAAAEKNFENLYEYMTEEFRYSFGGNSSRAEALTWYRKHPEFLDELARVLTQHCVLKTYDSSRYYICPAEAADDDVQYYDWRAGFRLNDDESWEFVWFVAGD